MRVGDGLIVVIDFDPCAVLGKFVGLDPIELVRYLKGLEQIAIKEIEKYYPDSYEARLELHRAIWMHNGRNKSDLLASILKAILCVVRELDRVNAEHRERGWPSTTFHAGLGEGRVELDSGGASGVGVDNACNCAEHARKTGTILVVNSNTLKDVPTRVLQELILDLPNDSPDYITLNRPALLRLSTIVGNR